MAEPEEIVAELEDFFVNGNALKGKNVLVTAGPTHEAIDPVRFIGNHSSGKMGFAIAESLANHGATVTLVSGPTSLHTSHPNVDVKKVMSAEEMYETCLAVFPKTDIAVLAAAVADYKPTIKLIKKSRKKMKRLRLS